MVDLFRCVGLSQLALGIISLMSGILAFFPVASYKPWYVGWSSKIATPVWTGLLAVIAGTCVLVAHREQKKKSMWELGYIFSILCTVTCPVHFSVAVASIMIGPYCYYSFRGAVGTEYLGYVVEFPFPYLRFLGLCLDPLHYEWYHICLQVADLLCSTAIFILSLTIFITLTLRVLRSGHVNMWAR